MSVEQQPPRWSVLVRAECSLCEILLFELAQLLPADQVEQVVVVDVDGDPQLQRKYGHRVPVLLAAGDFVCDYRLDEARVRAHLD